VYKEVFIKGYYRKSGIFVSPHIRKIKIKGYKGSKRILKSYMSVDKNQLCFDFSGFTLER
tara:strand:+ start:240 stop:419 length:180 start_codon:yes stop_codon:yes gene_type:complete